MKNYLLLFFTLIISKNILAQMGVNADGSLPHSSAQLDVKSANKGLLLPRVTSPASAIASPAAGLMVYDQANANLSYYNGASWQNLSGNTSASGLYARFPRSKSFHAGKNTSLPAFQSYTYTVPSGVNTIWVEMWAGGGYGNELPSTVTESWALNTGGHGGDFASIIMPVTSGEVLTIQVGKGGYNTANGGGDSRIMAPSGADYGVSRAQATCAYNATFAIGEVPGLIQFISGERGRKSTSSFEQSGATEFRRVIKGGNGGASFLGFGGDGIQVSYLMPAGTFLSHGGSYIGVDGSTPGGGGGIGMNAGGGGHGGPGLMIVHW